MAVSMPSALTKWKACSYHRCRMRGAAWAQVPHFFWRAWPPTFWILPE